MYKLIILFLTLSMIIVASGCMSIMFPERRHVNYSPEKEYKFNGLACFVETLFFPIGMIIDLLNGAFYYEKNDVSGD